jgi:hypothetical protein
MGIGEIMAQYTVKYDEPEPTAVPDAKEVKSDTDWEAKVHNKEIEVIQVLNIINPVAVYLTAGFEQYGEKIKDEIVHEEWVDTQAQLTKALTLYETCKKQKTAGKFDKKLFLNMEETWQLLVKTGVAGVRTKQMFDMQLQRL